MPKSGSKTPVQLPAGRFTFNLGWWIIPTSIFWALGGRQFWAAIKAAIPVNTWRHHPLVLLGLLLLFKAWLISPILLLALAAVFFPAVGAWMMLSPRGYRLHVEPRVRGFLWGFKHRYELRQKLIGCRIINDKERTPVHVRSMATDCTVKMRLKMIYGDSVQIYRDHADVLAPAFNATDCKARPVRGHRVSGLMARPPFVRFEPKDKPRLVELELLTRNPFIKPVSASFIDYHLDANNLRPMRGNATGMRRDGTPHSLPRGRHRLRVSATGTGKSGAFRADMYADRLDIYAGLLEVHAADGKGGTAFSSMEHLFARKCYGDSENPEDFDPWEFAGFFEAGVKIMRRRLVGMRGTGLMHTPMPGAPDLKFLIDDALAFDSPMIDGQARKRIWGALELIQRQGREAGVTVEVAVQDAAMDDLPIRRGFTDREVGWVKEQIQVDMAAGRGAYDRGMKADKIWRDQPGTFYAESVESDTPEEVRYAYVSDDDLRALKPAPKTVLWPLPDWQPTAKSGMTDLEPTTSEPTTEPEQKTARIYSLPLSGG